MLNALVTIIRSMAAIKKNPYLQTLGLSLLVAFVIFVTSVFSQFSNQMYSIASQQNNEFVRVGIGLIAILVISGILWVIFTFIPPFRKAISRMFGFGN